VTSGRIVRATGVCCRCDSRFRDEVVLAVVDARVPSGVAFIELRHLEDLDPALWIDLLGDNPPSAA
jgi:hypothetical protein